MLGEYLKDHVALLVVLIIIALIVAAFVVWLVILIYKQKHAQKSDEAILSEETKDEDTANAQEAKQEEETIQDSEEEPSKALEEEEMKKQEEAKKQEKKPAKATAAKGAKEEKPAKSEKSEAKAKPQKAQATGKWSLFEEDRGGFGFKLLASNGEVMLKSSSPYASLQSAKAGIKTYQDNIAAGRLEVVETKKGNFFVQVNNASGRMLATSADYPNRSGCESALQSIKRWAQTSTIVQESEDE